MAAVTMRDVALKAGVSEATVSYVVNGHIHRVSAKTRARVLAAISELDYTPNTVARSLASQATWTIGLVVSDVTRSPYTAAIKGVESVAMRFGYNVILCNADDNHSRLTQAIEVLAAKRVDGVAFVLSSRYDQPLPLSRLLQRSIPVVLVNRQEGSLAVPSILVDNTSGTYQLTQQLIEMGHRRIACIHLPINGPHSIRAAHERLTGYRDALEAHGLSYCENICREGALGEEMGELTGYRAAIELLGADNRPTALVCCNDYLALGAIRACATLGLSVPNDVAIVGHDNISAGRYIRPSLTSVDQPMLKAGEQATQLLVQLIWERTNKIQPGVSISANVAAETTTTYGPTDAVGLGSSTIRLPCTLVIRGSSGHLSA